MRSNARPTSSTGSAAASGSGPSPRSSTSGGNNEAGKFGRLLILCWLVFDKTNVDHLGALATTRSWTRLKQNVGDIISATNQPGWYTGVLNASDGAQGAPKDGIDIANTIMEHKHIHLGAGSAFTTHATHVSKCLFVFMRWHPFNFDTNATVKPRK